MATRGGKLVRGAVSIVAAFGSASKVNSQAKSVRPRSLFQHRTCDLFLLVDVAGQGSHRPNERSYLVPVGDRLGSIVDNSVITALAALAGAAIGAS